MKKVNIFVLLGLLALTLLLYPIGNSKWIPVGIRIGYLICWFFVFMGIAFFYDKVLDKRMRRLEKELGTRCLLIPTVSLLEEHYLLDLEGCRLIGLFGFNPFHFQYLDAAMIEDVEIIERKCNEYVVGAVVCCLHLQGKKCNIYLYRGTRMGLSVVLKEYKELMDYANKLRDSLLDASKRAREREVHNTEKR